MSLLLRFVINAFSIWIVSLIPVLTVTVTPFAPGGTLQLVLTLLLLGAIFAIVNAIVGTVMRVVTFPLYVLTLGLFSLIVNGFLLWVTAWVTSGFGWGLSVGSFWWGVVAALLIGIINGILGVIVRPKRDRRN
ncbi:phage holin family protein [uncultured Microbacterium sp.]|uniref:phage holin family protein n=1 Tax=uncultured Microbacterium sp. TaxID=191216 RepID=UPI002600B26B|nr:phage holin family protein [uncultured Microbacterium sp.]